MAPVFRENNVHLWVITPDPKDRVVEYWATHQYDIPAVPDPGAHVLRALGQPWSIWHMGRLPGTIVATGAGTLLPQFGHTMKDLPDWNEVLRLALST